MRKIIATLAFFVSIIAFSSNAMCETAMPTISNEAFRLGFDSSTGSNSQISDVVRARELLTAESATPLWLLLCTNDTQMLRKQFAAFDNRMLYGVGPA